VKEELKEHDKISKSSGSEYEEIEEEFEEEYEEEAEEDVDFGDVDDLMGGAPKKKSPEKAQK
jgi:hypothetical protein